MCHSVCHTAGTAGCVLLDTTLSPSGTWQCAAAGMRHRVDFPAHTKLTCSGVWLLPAAYFWVLSKIRLNPVSVTLAPCAQQGGPMLLLSTPELNLGPALSNRGATRGYCNHNHIRSEGQLLSCISHISSPAAPGGPSVWRTLPRAGGRGSTAAAPRGLTKSSQQRSAS